MNRATFNVADMTCAHCEKTIRGALSEAMPGVRVSVDLASHTVTVEGDGEKAVAAMEEVGYSPKRIG